MSKCKATRGCGTPTGWYNGGRCPSCRRVHNRLSREARGLTRSERQRVLGLLRAGTSADDAAAAIGRTARSLQTAAVRDGELRLALDGEPVAAQQAARRGDFLAALSRNGGIKAEAARELGMTRGDVQDWERRDRQWAAVIEQFIQWMAQSGTARGKGRIRTEDLDAAAAGIRAGRGLSAVAADLNLSAPGLAYHRSRHPGLDAALRERGFRMGAASAEAPPPTGSRTRKPPVRVTDEIRQQVQKLWPDRDLTRQDIADAAGISLATAQKIAREMGLPGRRQRRA